MKKFKQFLILICLVSASLTGYSITANVSTEKELQEAINKHFGTKDIVSEIKLTKDIGLTKEIIIPCTNTRQGFKALIIDLSGNTISDISTEGLKYLLGRIPKDQQEATLATSWSLILRNGCLKGKRLNNRTWTSSLLVLGSTFNSVVENIQLNGAINYGIEFRFCLMGRLQNILCNSIDSTAIYVGKGNWPGAGNNTSQSNGTIIEQVRVFNAIGATAFNIESSSMITLRSCISEGNPARYHLLWVDYPTTTTVQDGTVDNFYIEAPGTIKIVTKGSKLLKGIWMQHPTRFEFEALASVSTIYMKDIPYWPTGSVLKVLGSSSGLAVHAEEVAVDIRDNRLWADSKVKFPKLSIEVEGMPRYITYISAKLNKYCSNSNIRFNGIFASPAIPSNVKTNVPKIVSLNSSVEGTASAGNNDGGMYVYARGVVVRKSSDIVRGVPSIDTNDALFIDAGNGEGNFNYSVKLAPKTTYVLRSFAYNGFGTAYGEPQLITMP